MISVISCNGYFNPSLAYFSFNFAYSNSRLDKLVKVLDSIIENPLFDGGKKSF